MRTRDHVGNKVAVQVGRHHDVKLVGLGHLAAEGDVCGDVMPGCRYSTLGKTCWGLPTNCMHVLSTIISVYSMSGYFLAIAWHACVG